MPQPDELLRLLDRLERLEALPRTGWIPCGVQNPESIAAHSYMVTLTALLIADSIPEQVDSEKLLRIALLHDVAESILTDLPSPVKTLLGKPEVQRAEQQAANNALQHAPESWLQHHQLYIDRDCIEAQIVKAADTLQMLCKATIYHHQHRGDTRRFMPPADQPPEHDIPLVDALLKNLHHHFHHGTWFMADLD